MGSYIILYFCTDTSNTETGFEGCIYRMQVDNVFPLKRAFQDPKPDFIMLVPQGQSVGVCHFA